MNKIGDGTVEKSASGVNGFTSIGMVGNVNLNSSASSNNQGGRGSKGGGRTSAMLDGRPYAAAVVNDQTLIPPTAQHRTQENTLQSSTSSLNNNASLSNGGIRGSELASSQILDLDMIRVREAEKILLHEESIRGKWTRAPDMSGRIVPASQAEADLFLKDMGLDDMRPGLVYIKRESF